MRLLQPSSCDTITDLTDMSSKAKSPAANPTVVLDSTKDGSIIRKAFLVEAAANLFTIPLVTNTRHTLLLLLNNAAHINPASVLFARLFGGIVIGGLTSALLAGFSNTRNGIESRRPTYIMLAFGEALFIPILALEFLKDGSEDAAISKKMAGASIGCLVPPLLWRLHVLCVRPDLLGRYSEAEKDSGSTTRLDED